MTAIFLLDGDRNKVIEGLAQALTTSPLEVYQRLIDTGEIEGMPSRS
jgi:hypothetical protein